MSKTLDFEAQAALRAIYELLDVGLRPRVAVLAGLLGCAPTAVSVQIAELRRRGLLGRGSLTPTMVGLAVAVGLPPLCPAPMTGTVVWSAPRHDDALAA